MNYDKIGKFIQEKRKEKNLTQKELAKKLGVSDKAISKWERGICCPDISLLKDLSSILDISINELLSGEDIEKLEWLKENDYIVLVFTETEMIENKEYVKDKLLETIGTLYRNV